MPYHAHACHVISQKAVVAANEDMRDTQEAPMAEYSSGLRKVVL